MGDKAERVRQIGEASFKDAINIMRCVTMLREMESLSVAALDNAKAARRATNVIHDALLYHLLVMVERAFGPVRKTDCHARVAFEYLADPNIFEEVAKAGSRRHLKEACDIWKKYDEDPRRRRLKHYRDKVVASGTAATLVRLARGSGADGLDFDTQMAFHEKSAKAFWEIWQRSDEDC